MNDAIDEADKIMGRLIAVIESTGSMDNDWAEMMDGLKDGRNAGIQEKRLLPFVKEARAAVGAAKAWRSTWATRPAQEGKSDG